MAMTRRKQLNLNFSFLASFFFWPLFFFRRLCVPMKRLVYPFSWDHCRLDVGWWTFGWCVLPRRAKLSNQQCVHLANDREMKMNYRNSFDDDFSLFVFIPLFFFSLFTAETISTKLFFFWFWRHDK